MKPLNYSKVAAVVLFASTALTACNNTKEQTPNVDTSATAPTLLTEFTNRLDIYKEVTLTADLSHLSTKQKLIFL